jgi:hypothetical protein
VRPLAADQQPVAVQRDRLALLLQRQRQLLAQPARAVVHVGRRVGAQQEAPAGQERPVGHQRRHVGDPGQDVGAVGLLHQPPRRPVQPADAERLGRDPEAPVTRVDQQGLGVVRPVVVA